MAAERPDEDSTGSPQEAASSGGPTDPFLTQPMPDEPWDEAWLPQWADAELAAGRPPRLDPHAPTEGPPSPSARPLPTRIEAALAELREEELAAQRAADAQAAAQLAGWEEAIRAGEALAQRAASAPPEPPPVEPAPREEPPVEPLPADAVDVDAAAAVAPSTYDVAPPTYDVPVVRAAPPRGRLRSRLLLPLAVLLVAALLAGFAFTTASSGDGAEVAASERQAATAAPTTPAVPAAPRSSAQPAAPSVVSPPADVPAPTAEPTGTTAPGTPTAPAEPTRVTPRPAAPAVLPATASPRTKRQSSPVPAAGAPAAATRVGLSAASPSTAAPDPSAVQPPAAVPGPTEDGQTDDDPADDAPGGGTPAGPGEDPACPVPAGTTGGLSGADPAGDPGYVTDETPVLEAAACDPVAPAAGDQADADGDPSPVPASDPTTGADPGVVIDTGAGAGEVRSEDVPATATEAPAQTPTSPVG